MAPHGPREQTTVQFDRAHARAHDQIVAGAPVKPDDGWNPDHRLEWTPADAADFEMLADPLADPASLPFWWRVRRAVSGFVAPVLIMAALVGGAQFWVLGGLWNPLSEDGAPPCRPAASVQAGACS